MTAISHPGAELGLPLEWIDFDESPILFANHFLIQRQPNEFVLTLGQVTAPPVVGTPEEIREQSREFGHVTVNTLARVGLTRLRMTELISMLQNALDEHDRLFGS
jgi:hypothetical protein